jgi:serine/threonine-protein kinase
MMDRLHTALEGRYALEREVGEGGMATVYLAQDLKHRRKVAVKVLKPELAAVVGGERFLAEIETTARLQHPNILPLFDSGDAEGFLFYVMPYVEGESLRDRLEREKQLPVDEAVRMATEVAEALEAAHEHGVVHRDIKPANIMVSKGRPLVADFGIALAVSSAGGHRLTETGLSVGTPQYMSPEQASGDQVVGPTSDVYSLGCVLYEMLVGEPPHVGATAQAILGKVITTDPDPVTTHRRTVPPHVDAVVAKALEKVPADRFLSAADFAGALGDEAFRHGRTTAAGTATRGHLKATALMGWVAAVALGGLWLGAILQTDPPAPVRTLPLAYPEETGPSEWMELTPDGSALILSDRPRTPTVGGFNLFVQGLDDGVRKPIPGSEAGFDPAVSPDGSQVAFGGWTGVHVAPLSGGAARTLADVDGGACCIRWGGDGFVYYQANSTDIHRVRAVGGEPEPVLEAGAGGGLGYYRPVAGGRRAIVDVGAVGDDDRIEWVDVATGERHLVTQGRRPFLTEDGYLVFARSGSIYAGRFDLGDMAFTGDPVRMVERVGTTGLDAMFTLSESGDLAYWVPSGGEHARPRRDLIWVNRRGEITSVDPSFIGEIESVELSPDGTRAAVTVGLVASTEIWIKDLDDGPYHRLTSQPGLNRRPVWSPDGTRIAFISDRGGNRAVYTVEVDGIATPHLFLEHEGEDVDEVHWSADGDWMVYRTGTTPGDRDLYARRLGPDTLTIVVSAEPGRDEVSPILSPDGRWVAYMSDSSGSEEVWVRPFPDVERGSRQVSADLGLEPFWAPSGNELFFRTRAGLSAVPVEDGIDFRTGVARAFFSNQISMSNPIHRSYGYHEDRDRFLMIRDLGMEQVPAELILVQNFMDEVRRRVGS